MEIIAEIEGKDVGLKASAGTVRSYRYMYGRDLILDMGAVEKAVFEDKDLKTDQQEIVENVAYTMAKEYNRELPEQKEWLEQFSPYFCYKIVAPILNMWHENMRSLNSSKKN